MNRRGFLKTLVATAATPLLITPDALALKLFPNPSKRKWAILFGSRYGSTRDASVWISEGMNGIADVFDARENPDLSSFDRIVVGSGIYTGRIDKHLNAYLARNAAGFSDRIKAIFVVCGAGESPEAQAYIDVLARSCMIRSAVRKTFPGRLTRRLLTAEDDRNEEMVTKGRNQPYVDYDNLRRAHCLKFGGEILPQS